MSDQDDLARIAASLAAMVDSEGELVSGTPLAALTASTDDGVAASILLSHVQDLLGCDAERAGHLLAQIDVALHMPADGSNGHQCVD